MSDGVKFDGGKLRLDLIPPEVELALASVLTYGAYKYAPDGWRNVSVERYLAAEKRHDLAMRMGDVYDQESGLPHSWHKLACVAIQVALEHPHLDEIPRLGDVIDAAIRAKGES